MRSQIKVNDRRIGAGASTYVVAELSANHGGDFNRAVELVRKAKEAGADAVKLQTYTADTMTISSDREPFRIRGTIWNGRTLHDLYGEAHTPWEWQPRLKHLGDELGLDVFSSPFDSAAVDFLEQMQVPAYKVASFEIVDLQLIRRMARSGKPLIISTGMANLEEIKEAVGAAREAGATQIALLKCTSSYPAPAAEMNLRTIPDLAERLGVPVGLSDHTLGTVVPLAAVALGACIIEKHLTLFRAEGGPDSTFSLEPNEFKAMVEGIRIVERALGDVRYEPTAGEAASQALRRSLFIVRDMKAGEAFTEENLRSIRPAHGLAPKHLPELLGRRVVRNVERGTPLTWDLVI